MHEMLLASALLAAVCERYRYKAIGATLIVYRLNRHGK